MVHQQMGKIDKNQIINEKQKEDSLNKEKQPADNVSY
jgi:hypothetical protein